MTAAVARRDNASTVRRRSAGATGKRTPARKAAQPRSVSSRARAVRPKLRLLDQEAVRRRALRRNLALGMFVVLIIGFFAAALAQAQLVANQHELDVLRSRIAEADAERSRLERTVEESSAPGSIIEQAEGLGMVRASEPIYLAAVSPAPDVTPISLLGSTSAATAPAELIEADSGGEEMIVAAAVEAVTQGSAPIIATIAGTRAVATGIGTG